MANVVPKPPYPKAPIIEGVIHLSVNDRVKREDLLKLVKRFGKDYPQQETLSAINVGINTTAGAATVEQHLQGYRLKSHDQADIVMVFPDGVATARLAPYPGWEYLRQRAHSAWLEWRRSTTSNLQRIGIRYINRIDVPIDRGELLDIESYLRAVPHVPEFPKQPLKGFYVQTTGPTDIEYWNVTITSTLMSPPPLIDRLSLVLDIDVFRTEDIPRREADLWDCIDRVRALKNAIFESCITDEARKLFI